MGEVAVKSEPSIRMEKMTGFSTRWQGLESTLVTTMIIEWVIMALLYAFLIVRMAYSTDENWLYFVSTSVVVLIAALVIPLTMWKSK